jgi:hypothetical protein
MKKVLFLLAALVFFGNLLKAEVLKDAVTDKNEIKGGEEIVKIEATVSQPVDVRVSVWKDDKIIRVIDNLIPAQIKYSTVWNGKDQKGDTVKPGKYTIKVESDEEIILDKTFGENGVIADFVSPFTLKVAPDGSIWIIDRAEHFLCKYDKNGKAKNDFDGENRLKIGNAYNLDFDKDGFIYISSGGHQMYKMDQKGNILMKYGGHKVVKDEKGKGHYPPEGTTWGQVVGVGPENKLYIWAFGGIDAYNKGFPDFGGFLYTISGVLPAHPKTTGYIGPSGISNEQTGEIYWLWHTGWLSKMIDTGKELKDAYRYPGNRVFASPTGVGTNWLGEVYVANWGKNRIEKIFDTGGALNWIKSIGSPGKNIENREFFGIHDVWVDGDNIYVVEDGERIYNYEAQKEYDTPGNHRVSKWIKKFKESKEIEVTVK